jgi:hypothetical protein
MRRGGERVNTATAINKIIDRLPNARFQYVASTLVRIALNDNYYLVSFHHSFVVVPSWKLPNNIFEPMPQDEQSRQIENILNEIDGTLCGVEVSDYSDKVKAAVSKLLDHVASSKHNTLDMDTDEDFPMVHVWMPPDSFKAYGHDPSKRGESWSFLECCEHVLAKIETDEVSE